jgi:hypothetical protein
MTLTRGFIVKLIPKFKNSGYPETTVHPHKGEVSWSKTRAIKEAKFALKGRCGQALQWEKLIIIE